MAGGPLAGESKGILLGWGWRQGRELGFTQMQQQAQEGPTPGNNEFLLPSRKVRTNRMTQPHVRLLVPRHPNFLQKLPHSCPWPKAGVPLPTPAGSGPKSLGGADQVKAPANQQARFTCACPGG